MDPLAIGRRFRILTAVDEFARECLTLLTGMIRRYAPHRQGPDFSFQVRALSTSRMSFATVRAEE